jgi:hypothetical protein
LLSSSRNPKTALGKAMGRFGKGITVVNDNGSENMKDAELRDVVNKWLDQYSFYHPHESLDFLTPVE